MGTTVNWNELKQHVEQLKTEGKKLVFTNGCFDIIHAGHVRYLKEAKALGDILIVGLNSDTSVSAIKPGRPVNPQDQRAEVLSSLEMVDYVTIFGEDTPYKLIQHLQPDVLVKGGDWQIEKIVGAREVQGWGGTVHSIPFLHQRSTTALLNKIRSL